MDWSTWHVLPYETHDASTSMLVEVLGATNVVVFVACARSVCLVVVRGGDERLSDLG